MVLKVIILFTFLLYFNSLFISKYFVFSVKGAKYEMNVILFNLYLIFMPIFIHLEKYPDKLCNTTTFYKLSAI